VGFNASRSSESPITDACLPGASTRHGRHPGRKSIIRGMPHAFVPQPLARPVRDERDDTRSPNTSPPRRPTSAVVKKRQQRYGATATTQSADRYASTVGGDNNPGTRLSRGLASRANAPVYPNHHRRSTSNGEVYDVTSPRAECVSGGGRCTVRFGSSIGQSGSVGIGTLGPLQPDLRGYDRLYTTIRVGVTSCPLRPVPLCYSCYLRVVGRPSAS